MTTLPRNLHDQFARLHQQSNADPVLARAMNEAPKETLTANGIDTGSLTFAGDEVSGYMRSELPDNCICLWHNEWGECTVSFCL